MASSSYSSDNKQWVWMCASAVAAVAAVPLYLSLQKRKKTPKRSWSFTSEGMALGIFPSATKAPATIINAALYFANSEGGVPSLQELAAQVATPLLEYDRFSSLPNGANNASSSKTYYEATDLIRTIKVNAATEDELHDAIYKLLEDKLDVDNKPWWELVRIVNASQKKEARSVCLLRIHHCLGDGLSLVSAFDKILTTVDGKKAESKVTRAILDRKATATPSLSAILSALVHVVTLASSPLDDKTVFFKRTANIPYSGNRKVTLFPAVPLAYIKDLRKHCPFATTINDILMCAIGQAIHDYCVAEDDPILNKKAQKLQCRALLPVSLPRKGQNKKATAMSNKFCMLSADLSVGVSGVQERLRHIHATTCFLKTSPRAFIQLWLQNNVVSRLPNWVGRQTALDIFSRHSLVLTNIPGPEQYCLLASRRVTELQLFFPNVIPQVDLLSYAGNVFGNFIYDPTDLPRGDTLGVLFAKALVTLGREFKVPSIPSDLVEAAASSHQQQ